MSKFSCSETDTNLLVARPDRLFARAVPREASGILRQPPLAPFLDLLGRRLIFLTAAGSVVLVWKVEEPAGHRRVRDTQKTRGFVVFQTSGRSVDACRTRAIPPDPRYLRTRAIPPDAIATRPRRIRVRSAVSGARACSRSGVVAGLFTSEKARPKRKRAAKRKRAKEVSHRVSRGRRPESLAELMCESDTRKKNLADPSRQGRPDLFPRGRSRPFIARSSPRSDVPAECRDEKDHKNGRFSIGRTFFDTRSRRPAAKIGPDALFPLRAARTCRRLCTAPDTSRSAKTRFVQRTANGSDGGGVPPRSRRR